VAQLSEIHPFAPMSRGAAEPRSVMREIAGNRRRVIRVKACVRHCADKCAMSENLTFTNEVICSLRKANDFAAHN
jgi:hypothetical protein